MVRKLIGACVGLAMMGMAGTADAVPIELIFEFDMNDAASPPADPWTGTIIYNAASTTAQVDSIISVDMTVQGHSYTVGELIFGTYFTGPDVQYIAGAIGGVFSGLPAMISGTNDFRIVWVRSTGIALLNQETTLTAPGFSCCFTPLSTTEFSLTEAPEPSTLALFATGLVLLAFMGWRRRRSVQVGTA